MNRRIHSLVPAASRSLLVLAAIALLAAACSSAGGKGGAAGSTGATEGPVTLRLGYFPNITHATAITGIEQGIFSRDLGANVTLKTATFNAGPAAVEAIFSDALDASYLGPNPALNAYVQSHGDAVRIISGATSGGAFLVVRPGVNGAGDLRGKKVASPQLGNTQDVALRTWLQAQGLKTDLQGGGDVSVVPQENGATLDAFKAGEIAGAWVPEPWASRLVLEGGGKVLVDERDLWPGGQYATTLLVVRSTFIKQHPAVVQRLLQGQIDANDYVNGHPEESRRLVNTAIQRITGKPLSDAVLASAWQNLTFTNDPIAGSLRTSAEAAAKLGLLKLDQLDLARIFELAPLNTALASAGKEEIPAP